MSRLQIAAMTTAIAVAWPIASQADGDRFPSIGGIERKDPRLDQLIPRNAKIEKLAEGFDWSEGPVWITNGQYLLFNDIPKNTTFKWTEARGIEVYLKPSGYSGESKFVGREPGANGLALDKEGRLLLCQHGDRRVVRQERDGKFTDLVNKFDGKRLNSPNDLCVKSNGDIYFTDPPYGLPKLMADPEKEMHHQGVYRISSQGKVTLLHADLTRPNGIAFSPDEKTLYVANSDDKRPVIMAFPVKADGTLDAGKVFFDAKSLAQSGRKGMPDGLKVDRNGNLFATGPGGVLIITTDGTHLGTIETGEPTANCCWGDDGSTLYITANRILCRLRTTTKGMGF